MTRLRPLSLAIATLAMCAVARAEPAKNAGKGENFPILHDDGRPSQERDALVLVVEGLDGIIRPAALRVKLSGVFGRPVVALSDSEAESARATLWIAADDKQVTLRLSTPPRADLWQRIPRAKLGADPGATLSNALLDMLWSERMRPQSEMRDPFCAPGTVCGAQEAAERRPVEQNVLDPWDPAYARLDRGERGSARGDAWENEQPASIAEEAAPGAGDVQSAPRMAAAGRPLRVWALALLAGGGVHSGGGFARYEFNALRRFPRFDLGMTFVGGRGQPDAARARRAFAALAQYRFLMEGLEIDLGGCFGVLTAERHGGADVLPYLRVLGAFAIQTKTPLDVLIQSELGTTFTRDAEGPVEYALSLGMRYAF